MRCATVFRESGSACPPSCVPALAGAVGGILFAFLVQSLGFTLDSLRDARTPDVRQWTPLTGEVVPPPFDVTAQGPKGNKLDLPPWVNPYDPAAAAAALNTSRETCTSLKARLAASRTVAMASKAPLFVEYYTFCVFEPAMGSAIDLQNEGFVAPQLHRELSDKPRFIVYRRPKDSAFGWGNMVRAIFGILQIALLTDRVLLIDVPLFHIHFDPPPGIEWRFHLPKVRAIYDRFSVSIFDAPQDPSVIPTLLGATTGHEWDTLLGSNADSIVVGWGHDVSNVLGQNLRLSAAMDHLLFGTTAGWDRRVMIARYALQRPTARLLSAVRGAKATIGLPDDNPRMPWESRPNSISRTYTAIQFRVFRDDPAHDTFVGREAELLKCLRVNLDRAAAEGYGVGNQGRANDVRIFMTTDDPDMFGLAMVQAALAEYGTVVSLPPEQDKDRFTGFIEWPTVAEMDDAPITQCEFLLLGSVGSNSLTSSCCCSGDRVVPIG